MIEDDWPHRDFADRMGLMFNFSESILLADAHKFKAERGFERHTESCDDIKQAVLAAKASLMGKVIDGCDEHNDSARIRWPKVDDSGTGLSYEPFLRFYMAIQRDQDLAVRVLRDAARDAMAGCSPALKKLSVLDRTLDDTLWEHTRRFFTMIPRLLERRFRHLQTQQQPQWLHQFRKDVQALLLAELDLRLQPVLGMVEALEKEVTHAS